MIYFMGGGWTGTPIYEYQKYATNEKELLESFVERSQGFFGRITLELKAM